MNKPRRLWPVVTAALIGVVALVFFAINLVPQACPPSCDDEYYADSAKEFEPVPEEITLPDNPE